jgi:hypothetical protein
MTDLISNTGMYIRRLIKTLKTVKDHQLGYYSNFDLIVTRIEKRIEYMTDLMRYELSNNSILKKEKEKTLDNLQINLNKLKYEIYDRG